MAGWLRDIIGAIGDGLSGENTYANFARERKIGEVMGPDFIDNPLEAVKRLHAKGFTKEAQELYNDFSDRKAKADALAATTSNRVTDNNRAMDPYVGGIIRAARGRPEAWPMVRKTIETLKRTRGYDAPFGDLPEEYSDEVINGLEYFGYTPSNIVSMDNNIRTTDTSNQNNIRTNEQSDTNNKRTTGTSAANNQRSTATSRENNIRSTATSRANNRASVAVSRENSIRAATSSGSKGGGRAAPSMPPSPPRKKNDGITGPDGVRWISPNGKSWQRAPGQ